MKTPAQILTQDHTLKTIEISHFKSETYEPGGKSKFTTSTDIYVNGEKEPSASVWSLSELFHLTMSIWAGAIKTALGKRI